MARWIRLLLALELLWAPWSWAATETLEYGTPVVFTDSGGTVTFDVTGLANTTGRLSARHDLGVTRNRSAALRCVFQGASAMTLGATVEIYAAWSDGTDPDGEMGSTDANLPAEKRLNMDLAMMLFVDTVSTDTDITGSTEILLQDRYIQLGLWNVSGVTSEAGAGTTKCTLTPLIRKVQ